MGCEGRTRGRDRLRVPAARDVRPPPGAVWQLLVGDETALPTIGAIIERLGEGQSLRAFVEVAGAAEEQRFETLGDVRIDWVHRGDRPHGEAVVDAVKAAEFPDGAPYAWISGEADLVKFTRRHLVRERGIDKRAITFTGYWRQGRTEEDGRETSAAPPRANPSSRRTSRRTEATRRPPRPMSRSARPTAR
jgi:NADPH-dependent ferric siderophore reductase